MRDIIEILRLSQDGRSVREVARIVDVSRTTVGEIMRRADLAGVSYPVPADWDNAVLEAKLYPPTAPSGVIRPLPDWPPRSPHGQLNPRPKSPVPVTPAPPSGTARPPPTPSPTIRWSGPRSARRNGDGRPICR